MPGFFQSKDFAYLLAILTTLAYAGWYIFFNMLASLKQGIYAPIFPLLLIEVVSASLNLVATKGNLHLYQYTDAVFPVVAGALYAAANYLLYVVVVQIGLPFASSFASAEIIFFALLLWLKKRYKKNLLRIAAGSAIIAAGLVIESAYIYNVHLVFNSALMELGLLMAFVYGLATFFYYLSTVRIESKSAANFYVQAAEVVLFGYLFISLRSSIPLPVLNISYFVLAFTVGFLLFVSFLLETTMMKALEKFDESVVAKGYILSDLQLLPLLAYAIYTMPSLWYSYTPGMLLITLGMVVIYWRNSEMTSS